MSNLWTEQEDRILAEEISSAETVDEGCANASDLLDRTAVACASRYRRILSDNMESILSDDSQDDSRDQAMTIHSTTDYNIFKLLDMNRDIDPRHVNTMMNLIQKWGGMLFNLLVIRTSCITGVEELFMGDGQHRLFACKELGIPVPYVIVDVDSPREVAELIADTNNNSKGWRLENYLHVWSSIGIDSYKVVQQKFNNTGIQLSLLIQFYGLEYKYSAVSRRFKSGIFEIPNLEKSVSLINTYRSCLPYVSDDYHKFLKDFAGWVITNHPDKDKLLNVVKNHQIPVEEVTQTLDRLYNS